MSWPACVFLLTARWRSSSCNSLHAAVIHCTWSLRSINVLRQRVFFLTARWRSSSCNSFIWHTGGNTALHVAASNNFREAVALLLDRRAAAVNSSNQWGETPLFLAAEEDEVIICRLLLEARADMRAQDCDGDTPLHVALRAACCDTAALLLEFRASPAIINNAGHDALRIARASDDEAMHRLFFYWSWSTLCPTPFVCVFSDRTKVKHCFTSVCVSSDRTEALHLSHLSAVACDSSVRAGHRRYCSAVRAKKWCGSVQVTVDADTRVTMTVFSFHQVTCGGYWYIQCVHTLPNVLLGQNGSMSIYLVYLDEVKVQKCCFAMCFRTIMWCWWDFCDYVGDTGMVSPWILLYFSCSTVSWLLQGRETKQLLWSFLVLCDMCAAWGRLRQNVHDMAQLHVHVKWVE